MGECGNTLYLDGNADFVMQQTALCQPNCTQSIKTRLNKNDLLLWYIIATCV